MLCYDNLCLVASFPHYINAKGQKLPYSSQWLGYSGTRVGPINIRHKKMHWVVFTLQGIGLRVQKSFISLELFIVHWREEEKQETVQDES